MLKKMRAEPNQLVVKEPGFVRPVWMDRAFAFEKKNEFNLKDDDGKPIEYKVDNFWGMTDYYVTAIKERGSWMYAIHRPEDSIPIAAEHVTGPGIYFYDPQLPTTPEPMPLPPGTAYDVLKQAVELLAESVQASNRRYAALVDSIAQVKIWKVGLYERKSSPISISGADIVIALDEDLVEEFLLLLREQEARDTIGRNSNAPVSLTSEPPVTGSDILSQAIQYTKDFFGKGENALSS